MALDIVTPTDFEQRTENTQYFTVPCILLQIYYSLSPYPSTPYNVATDSTVQGIINKIKYAILPSVFYTRRGAGKFIQLTGKHLGVLFCSYPSRSSGNP
jgi:hypothetical protein